jgi:hypothetical protein
MIIIKKLNVQITKVMTMVTDFWWDLVFSVCGSTFVPPNRGVEQLVARWAHNPKVTSSSLVPATKTKIQPL